MTAPMQRTELASSTGSVLPVALESSGQDAITQLYDTKTWLQAQIKETKAACIAARDKTPPSSDDPEKLLESVTQLQTKLLEVSIDNSLKELLFRRVQLGQTLEQHLFSTPVRSDAGDARPARDSERHLLPLVERQARLASEVLRLHKAMEDMKPDLEEKRKKTLELIQGNRELMANIQQTKEDMANKKKRSASEAVQKAQQKLEKVLSDITLVQHCFQGLVVGSGVNWAKNQALMELIVSLGQPPPLDP